MSFLFFALLLVLLMVGFILGELHEITFFDTAFTNLLHRTRRQTARFVYEFLNP